MPTNPEVSYSTYAGAPRVLTPIDLKKISSQLIAQLMHNPKRTNADIALIVKLMGELRSNTELADTRKRIKQLEDKITKQ